MKTPIAVSNPQEIFGALGALISGAVGWVVSGTVVPTVSADIPVCIGRIEDLGQHGPATPGHREADRTLKRFGCSCFAEYRYIYLSLRSRPLSQIYWLPAKSSDSPRGPRQPLASQTRSRRDGTGVLHHNPVLRCSWCGGHRRARGPRRPATQPGHPGGQG